MRRKERAIEYLKKTIATASYLIRNFDKIDDVSGLTLQDVIFAFGKMQSASIDFNADIKLKEIEARKNNDNNYR